MRGFDLWLAALKKSAEVAGFAHTGVALRAIRRPAVWVEVSWFLILPLSLTACILCPVSARRTRRARYAESGNAYKRETTISLTMAGGVGFVIVAYLLLVVAFHRS